MSNKKDIDSIRKAFEGVGYTLLSDTYKNNKIPLDFVCDKGHTHKISWADFNSNKRCGKCFGAHTTDNNNLGVRFPHLIDEWIYDKNYPLTPFLVRPYSHKVVWWRCEKGHEWESAVKDRVKVEGCPYCGGKRACKDNCLATLRPDIAAQWHSILNGTLTPNDFTCGSGEVVWWQCETGKKGHEWETTIASRVYGNGCPYCDGKKVCEDNCLATLRPDIANEWNYIRNVEITPRDVTYGSTIKVWWVCKEGHEWFTEPYNRCNGNGCPQCSKGPVSKISQEWLDSLGVPIENREIFLSDLKMRVDAFVSETSTVYEFFGDYWHGNLKIFSENQVNKAVGKTFGQLYEETKTRVIRLKEAGYKIIYIWEKDFKNSLIK